MGVIYSSSGFSRNALTKAEACGIACCRLYRDEPADLPEVVFLTHYVCKPRVAVNLLEATNLPAYVRTWNDLFETPVDLHGNSMSLLDAIVAIYAQTERTVVQDRAVRMDADFPKPWWRRLEVVNTQDPSCRIKMRVAGTWACYRAKLEANIVNGSYCFKNGAFLGRQHGPAIDTQALDPGQGWEEVDPKESLPKGNYTLLILSSADVRGALTAHLGDKPINR